MKGLAWLGVRTEVGIEFLTAREEADGSSWSHFRAPDGNVYELLSRGSKPVRSTRIGSSA